VRRNIGSGFRAVHHWKSVDNAEPFLYFEPAVFLIAASSLSRLFHGFKQAKNQTSQSVQIAGSRCAYFREVFQW
jgi:hypothetical protein